MTTIYFVGDNPRIAFALFKLPKLMSFLQNYRLVSLLLVGPQEVWWWDCHTKSKLFIYY